MNWFGWAAMATIVSAFNVILCKYNNIFSPDDVTCFQISLVFTGLVSSVLLLLNIRRLRRFIQKSNAKVWTIITLITVTNILSWYFWTFSISKIDNPGLPHAIINTNVVIVFLASSILFDAKITKKSFVGILSIIIGIYILAFNQR